MGLTHARGGLALSGGRHLQLGRRQSLGVSQRLAQAALKKQRVGSGLDGFVHITSHESELSEPACENRAGEPVNASEFNAGPDRFNLFDFFSRLD